MRRIEASSLEGFCELAYMSYDCVRSKKEGFAILSGIIQVVLAPRKPAISLYTFFHRG
jgi:hypothetical protein